MASTGELDVVARRLVASPELDDPDITTKMEEVAAQALFDGAFAQVPIPPGAVPTIT